MTKQEEKSWSGTTPTTCDLCYKPFASTFYDARTKQGRWGLLCRSCFKEYGMGLGTGLGQEYDLRTLKKLRG